MKTEIMFPNYVIPMLRDACGPAWRRLVDRVAALEESEPEALAFSLMMIRLDGCLECETDSFRAMRGCAACALQAVRRYRNNEGDLLAHYKTALKDVRTFIQEHEPAPAQPAARKPAPKPARTSRPARRSSQPAAAR